MPEAQPEAGKFSGIAEAGELSGLSRDTTVVVSDVDSISPTVPFDEETSQEPSPGLCAGHEGPDERPRLRTKGQSQTVELRRSQRSQKKPSTNGIPREATAPARGGIAKRSRQHKEANNLGAATEWVVEKILDAGIDSETLEHSYLVKWEGYSRDESTWEPKRNLTGCPDAIQRFDESRPAYKKSK